MNNLSYVYRDKSPSLETKATLATLHLGIVLVATWLLVGGGIAQVSTLLHWEYQLTNVLRRAVLVAAAWLYFSRTLVTIFIFMRRRMPWSEVWTIAVWILAIDVLFAFLGGQSDESFGAAAVAGTVLVVVGSLINTCSEWQRHIWKQQATHQGRLYRNGFWALARHINYFGDLILFTGWALVTGRLVLLVVPVVMFLGFAYVNIPAQDKYLAERYGDEYYAYAKTTARLIPFVY